MPADTPTDRPDPDAAAGSPPPDGADGFSLTGQMLIATPTNTDPHFVGSVVYLCAHSDEGAMGIVLNRPLDDPSFDDLLQQLGIEPTPPARRIALCAGGPAENTRGFVLHTSDWTGDGSLRVDSALALTASLDVLKAIATGGGPRQGILALGYAGWGPKQLDRELEENVWIAAPAVEGLVFDGEHATKWRRAFASMQIDPLLLSMDAGHA